MNTQSKPIRFFWRGLLLAACFTITSFAQTNTIPLGSYTAVIPQDVRLGNLTVLSGEYQLTLLTGGKYQLSRNNFITLSGTYTVSGNLVKFASPATMDNCSGEGMYQWAVTGNRLTLTAANARVDSCVERLIGLTGGAFFKDDPANNAWKSLGPSGGQFNAVMLHDGKIYAGSGGGGFLGTITGGGVFISADNGQTWRATRGICGGTVTYAGCVPGLVGLNQFNVTIPAGLAAGTHTLVITRSGVASNSVTIAIR